MTDCEYATVNAMEKPTLDAAADLVEREAGSKQLRERDYPVLQCRQIGDSCVG